MDTAFGIIGSLAVGLVLGFIFFWGLWKTVQRMPSVKNPYLWMIVSFGVRLAIVLMGFYLLLLWQWQFVAVALIGFVMARFILLNRFGKSPTEVQNNLDH